MEHLLLLRSSPYPSLPMFCKIKHNPSWDLHLKQTHSCFLIFPHQQVMWKYRKGTLSNSLPIAEFRDLWPTEPSDAAHRHKVSVALGSKGGWQQSLSLCHHKKKQWQWLGPSAHLPINLDLNWVNLSCSLKRAADSWLAAFRKLSQNLAMAQFHWC